MREPLHLHVARDVDGAGLADAREVVAAEVDEHHVLGPVLLGREQPLDVALGRLGRAGDRAEARAAVLAGHEPLRRRADERDPVELEQEEVRRRVDAAQGAVDVEGRGRRRPLGALRRHALEDVAGDDVLLDVLDHLDVALARRASGGSAPAVPRGSRRHGDAGLEPPGDLLRRRPRAPRRCRRRGRSGRASRRRRAGSPGSRGRRPAAAPSARAAPRGRRRGSRRSAGRARPPRRTRRCREPAPIHELRPSRPRSTDSRMKLAVPASRRRR